MPTQNRRIATYLPKEIDEKFKAFKLDRGITGDSQALLAVLSEFLGVTEVVVPSMSIQYEELSQQLSDFRAELTCLESKLFSRLKSELLAEINSEILDSSVDRLRAEGLSVSVPGQLNLLAIELPDPALSVKSDLSRILTGEELAKRLQVPNSRSLRDQISRHKDDASYFSRWSSKKDPEGIPWERSGKGLYRPIQNLNEVDPVEDF
jgi:hypothetical protein